jgi:hypothetical protein
MVWGCFAGNQLGPLLTFEQGGIGSDEYQDVLYDGLLGLLDDLDETEERTDSDWEEMVTTLIRRPRPYLFMHDNAPCHKTADVAELLADNGIPVMKWPANSPDLNPIENLWRDMKTRFYLEFQKLKLVPSASKNSYARYEEILQHVWSTTDPNFVWGLVSSMPRRVQAVLAAQGGHIHY